MDFSSDKSVFCQQRTNWVDCEVDWTENQDAKSIKGLLVEFLHNFFYFTYWVAWFPSNLPICEFNQTVCRSRVYLSFGCFVDLWCLNGDENVCAQSSLCSNDAIYMFLLIKKFTIRIPPIQFPNFPFPLRFENINWITSATWQEINFQLAEINPAYRNV